MTRRAILRLAPVIAMIAAAWFVLRAPDADQTMVFFTSGVPSLAAGEATMTIIAWLVVAGVACLAVVSALREIRRSRRGGGSTSVIAAFLVAGVMLLAVGAVRHSLPGPSVCCGSGPANVREAIQLAR
jgi:hypothetical protein